MAGVAWRAAAAWLVLVPAAIAAALDNYDAEITIAVAFAALGVPALFGAIVRTGPSWVGPPPAWHAR